MKKRSRRFIDLTGLKYGRWTVLEFAFVKNKQTYWNCICDCGNTGVVRSGHLRDSKHPSGSCGCLMKEIATKHGYYTKGKENPGILRAFNAYESMLRRTKPDAQEAYKKYYYDKGITVTDQRWLDSVDNFISDMGPCPENMSLDRIDNGKGYSKDNCRWATSSEQITNRSTKSMTPEVFAKISKALNEGKTNSEISKKTNFSESTISGIRNGRQIYCHRHEFKAVLSNSD